MYLWFFCIYALFLTYALLTPAGTESFDVWDKLLHFIAYAVFALLGRGVVRPGAGYHRLCVVIVLYGGTMEYLQSMVPGRDMSAGDLVANALGVAAAVIMVRIYSKKMRT